jgi:hypothetical protein
VAPFLLGVGLRHFVRLVSCSNSRLKQVVGLAATRISVGRSS